MIKVFSVCKSDLWGGAAKAAYRIHRSVIAQGADSRMFVLNKGINDNTIHPLSEYKPNNLIYNIGDWIAHKVKNKWQHLQWHPYPNRDNNVKSDLRSTRIHGALQSWDYDILHLHWINGRFLPLEELRKLNKPIVWTMHDSWPFCGLCHYFLDCEGYKKQCGCCPQLGSTDRHDLSHRVWKKKMQIFRELDLHIVSPSRWLADCARESSLLGKCDIRVIPNCLDTNIFRPLSTDEIISLAEQDQNAMSSRILCEATQEKRLAKPFILYGAVAAATDRRKGFASLLSALQKMDEQGFSAKLVVFGANETDLQLNFKNIEVVFVGYIRNMHILSALYSIADIMIVPSLTENLSCAIMEAMSCQTPVVAFNIGGNSDMIEHRINGYLAAPKDTDDLAEGIKWTLHNNQQNELGKAARLTVLQKFTPEIVAKQYIDLYNEINLK